MTKKTTSSNKLHFRAVAAAALVILLPARAFAAVDDAKSDLEVKAGEPSPQGLDAGTTSTPTSPTPNAPRAVSPGVSTAAASVPAPAPGLPSAPATSAPPAGPLPAGAAAQTPAASSSTASALEPPPGSEVAGTDTSHWGTSLVKGLWIGGYFQAQYESHQDSEDQLRQGGALLNQNRFLLRRGRIRIGREWDYAELLVEVDGNTVHGPAFRWQKAEASLIYGRSKEKDVAPLVQFTMGIFDLPFGYELPEQPKTRPFMERSFGGRALWPSEPDVGARLSGQIKFFRYALALTNGEPLDEKSGYGLQDPNNNKDVTVRLGAITKPWSKFTVSGDITYNAGKGFHPGTDATKPVVIWSDANHNGVVDVASNELIGSAVPATPSQNFGRWALGADAQVVMESSLGKSTLYGEIVVAQNMDRGLFIADPIALSGTNTREMSYYVAFIQEVTPYGLVGFRTDFYDPNSDFAEPRAGVLVPTSQAIRNYSPIVGAVLPDRAKLLFEWDIQSNLLARDVRGVPTRYPDNQWTLRLQVNL